MVSESIPPLKVRPAQAGDIPALAAIKGAGSEALHRDRLRESLGSGFSYLVLLRDQEVIGFACLVSRRPASWSDAGDQTHLPQIIDLQVKEVWRGQGFGSAFIHAIEGLAAKAGYRQLYISVEPSDNPRAFALYQRLGYRPLQIQPYQKIWRFTDSSGIEHRGQDWVVDLVKQL